ncbi:hypothetical protein FOZ61_004587 [Perkinsus olseni]|uniref:Plastocyanin-like domain-containing protein n=1 Tax=Perkinsus olseni TaxID=32597 RepID=A0A7J6MT57_PEROL|nr:hypothetical protein FOZ61_004587 [Perkinsus olseni]KAF4674704.1 hypothetical protein FOL46_004232 [Perkinsus olseni]
MRFRHLVQFIASATSLLQQLYSTLIEHDLILDLAGPQLMESVGIQHWRPRVYNGRLVGPTIRVSPGDTLRINIVNKLKPPEGKYHSNHVGRLNATNLHVHGMHVSPDEDNIFLSCQPGDNLTYVYHIPQDHVHGTYMYHAHLHGSTNVQVGQGLAGALIVGPANGKKEFPFEENLVLGHVCFNCYKLEPKPTADAQGVDWPFYSHEAGDINGPPSSLRPEQIASRESTEPAFSKYLVNGLVTPSIQVPLKEWGVLRFIHPPVAAHVNITILPTGACEMRVIGTDGVPLTGGSRTVTSFVLVPASRRDIALRCDNAGQHVQFVGVRHKSPDNYWYAGEILSVVPVSSVSGSPTPPRYPEPTARYLTDTRNLSSTSPPFHLKFGGYLPPFPSPTFLGWLFAGLAIFVGLLLCTWLVFLCLRGFGCVKLQAKRCRFRIVEALMVTVLVAAVILFIVLSVFNFNAARDIVGNRAVNGKSFTSATDYLTQMHLGDLNEWVYETGDWKHPVHMHTYPVQIVRFRSNASKHEAEEAGFIMGSW